MKVLIFLIAILTIAPAYADWNEYLWTSKDVENLYPRRVDFIGKSWYREWIPNEPYTNNVSEVGKQPYQVKLTVRCKYRRVRENHGWTHIWFATDLVKGDWVSMGRYRTHMRKDYELTIPIWDKVYADKLRNAKSVFIKTDSVANRNVNTKYTDPPEILKWVVHDGDKVTVIMDNITPKPKPQPIPLTSQILMKTMDAIESVFVPEQESPTAPSVPGSP
jgi:hypothetical protein